MAASQLVFVAVLLCAGLAVVAVIALASRHKKSATGQLDLIGAVASVETDLEPEGSVLVRGEMWRACLRRGSAQGCGSRVRIVGASGHLLLVEPLE
ncbi:MAG: NfeD family protein [Pyrinomonadaceae bacterium]